MGRIELDEKTAGRSMRAVGGTLGVMAALAGLLALGCVTGQPVSTGSRLSGNSRLYELQVVGTGWRQVEPGTLGDSDSDLELRRNLGLGWVIVYVHEAKGLSLDEVVDARREAIRRTQDIAESEESRSFVKGSNDFGIVSRARYRVGRSFFTRAFFAVRTLEVGDRIIEIIGFNADLEDELARNREILATVDALVPVLPGDVGAGS